MSELSIPNGIQTRKMLSFAGTELQMLMTTTVLCALKTISKEKKSGYSVRDCVSSGITNSVFSISLLFRLFLLLFLLVYRSYSFLSDENNILSDDVYFIFSFFACKRSTKCYSLGPNKVIKRSAFFYFAKCRKFRCFECFPKNVKSFCRTEGSDIVCLSLMTRLLSIIFLIFNRGHPFRNSKRQPFQKMFSCYLKLTYIPSDKDSLAVDCSS